MKHIEKRFYLQVSEEQLKERAKNFEVIELNSEFDPQSIRDTKNKMAMMLTDKGQSYGCFLHKESGSLSAIPVPDPTLVYFHIAWSYADQISEARDSLIQKTRLGSKLTEPAIIEIYRYYGTVCGFVVYLFTSIEAFINQLIPDTFVFKMETSKKTELYTKRQIEEGIAFVKKLKEVLPQATGKNFFQHPTAANSRIWNLKEFRDDIIHTKPGENPLKYDGLIKKSLGFKFQETLDAVKLFMNHYKPGHVVDCTCDKTH